MLELAIASWINLIIIIIRIIIIIITVLMSAVVPIFPNEFKAPQG